MKLTDEKISHARSCIGNILRDQERLMTKGLCLTFFDADKRKSLGKFIYEEYDPEGNYWKHEVSELFVFAMKGELRNEKIVTYVQFNIEEWEEWDQGEDELIKKLKKEVLHHSITRSDVLKELKKKYYELLLIDCEIADNSLQDKNALKEVTQQIKVILPSINKTYKEYKNSFQIISQGRSSIPVSRYFVFLSMEYLQYAKQISHYLALKKKKHAIESNMKNRQQRYSETLDKLIKYYKILGGKSKKLETQIQEIGKILGITEEKKLRCYQKCDKSLEKQREEKQKVVEHDKLNKLYAFNNAKIKKLYKLNAILRQSLEKQCAKDEEIVDKLNVFQAEPMASVKLQPTVDDQPTTSLDLFAEFSQALKIYDNNLNELVGMEAVNSPSTTSEVPSEALQEEFYDVSKIATVIDEALLEEILQELKNGSDSMQELIKNLISFNLPKEEEMLGKLKQELIVNLTAVEEFTRDFKKKLISKTTSATTNLTLLEEILEDLKTRNSKEQEISMQEYKNRCIENFIKYIPSTTSETTSLNLLTENTANLANYLERVV